MIEFKNLTKKRIGFKKFRELHKKIFPPAGRAGDSDFELSVVLAGNKMMQNLNRRYKRRSGAADVLAFRLGKNAGEIFINAKLKNLEYLFVHGELHLKGFDHAGSKSAQIMERKEKAILNQ